MSEQKIFPSTKHEALALLYVQKQDLSDKSPSDVLYMYESAYKEIREAKAKSREKQTSF